MNVEPEKQPAENLGNCRCGKNDSVDSHSCPYECEINNDHSNYCNCCAECENKCGDEI